MALRARIEIGARHLQQLVEQLRAYVVHHAERNLAEQRLTDDFSQTSHHRYDKHSDGNGQCGGKRIGIPRVNEIAEQAHEVSFRTAAQQEAEHR